MSNQFQFEELELKDSYLISPFVANDIRGSFIKDYSSDEFNQIGFTHELKEVFYTKSKAGVIRAIHFQRVYEQPKIVRCISGKIFDVIVDLRFKSDTFGKWLSFYLDDVNNNELLIPKGFGHGYLVIEPAIVSYKCTEKFYGDYDDGIIWNDKDINIKWPIHMVDNIILSEKDKKLQSFTQFQKRYCNG